MQASVQEHGQIEISALAQSVKVWEHCYDMLVLLLRGSLWRAGAHESIVMTCWCSWEHRYDVLVLLRGSLWRAGAPESIVMTCWCSWEHRYDVLVLLRASLWRAGAPTERIDLLMWQQCWALTECKKPCECFIAGSITSNRLIFINVPSVN